MNVLKKGWPYVALGLGVIVVLGAFAVYFLGRDMSPGAGTDAVAKADTAEDLAGYEVIHVSVSNDGFVPNVIEVKAGVPTKINFNLTRKVTHINSVLSSKLGMDFYLQKGDNYYTIDPNVKPGEYEFNCGMYMEYGTIKVL